MNKLYITLVIILALLGIGYWGYTLFPKGQDRSLPYEIVGSNHISDDSPRPENYNSNPPTSGAHYAEPAPNGYYEEALPDEQVIHNLEHGDVWISYRSSVPQNILVEIKSLADGPFVIITKRDENPMDVALASWGRLDIFNLDNGILDKKRIEDFILRYENKGPEKIPASMKTRK